MNPFHGYVSFYAATDFISYPDLHFRCNCSCSVSKSILCDINSWWPFILEGLTTHLKDDVNLALKTADSLISSVQQYLKFKPWTQSSCFCCFLSKSMISSFDHREKKKDSINNSPETLDILKIVLNATDASSLQTVFRRMIEHILLEFLVFNAFNAIAFLSQTFLGKTWVGKRTTTFRSRTALTEQQKTDTQNKEEWKWDHVWNWIRLTKDDLWAERIPYKRLLLCKGIS